MTPTVGTTASGISPTRPTKIAPGGGATSSDSVSRKPSPPKLNPQREPRDAADKPKTREDLELVEIDSEAVVYDPESDSVQHLNLSAKLVFQLCDGTATPDETASEIAEAFELPLETVERDVRDAVLLLRDFGLLERAAGAAGAQERRRAPICLDARSGPCTEQVDRLAWPVNQSYELGPYRLGVRTNSERFGAWLADALSEHRSAERIGALYSVLIPEDAGRRRGERLNVLYRDSLVLARTPELSELVRTLRFELESFLFADWDEALLLETAVVSIDGVAVLVPSLTAVELFRDRKRVERTGASVPPGGRTAIDPESGRQVPVPARLAVLDDRLGKLLGAERASLSSSPNADRPSAFDVVCLPAPLGRAGLESISRGLAVQMLAGLVPNLPRLRARATEGLARFIEGVPCYQFTLRPGLMLDAIVEATRSRPLDVAEDVRSPRSANPAPATELPPFDKYAYYTASVQFPERAMRRLDRFYRDARGGAEPRALREDFSGTFVNSCAWVTLGSERRAVAVDLDPEPIAYGCSHGWARLKPSARVRVQVIADDVLRPGLPRADVIAALNFSYFVFKTRAELLAYFRSCLATLEPRGLLALDCFGAADRATEGSRRHGGFTYFWEQEGFDPVTHEAVFHIHFQRDGERKRRRVFTYDWRVWTVGELRDALLEAGFASVRTYWQAMTPDGKDEGELSLADRAPEHGGASWWNYVVGLR